MGQISVYHEAPYQGISQAPPQVRRKDQAEALEDCIVAIPEGLQKRPPFQLVGSLPGHLGQSNGIFHFVERELGNALLTITQDSVGVATARVYDFATLTAQPLTVDVNAQTYLNVLSFTPSKALGANTVADTTFIWSREQTVLNSATTEPARPIEALIFVRGGAYARTYEIFVNVPGVGTADATVHTPNGTSPSDGDWVDTGKIASGLMDASTYAISGTNGAIAGGGISAPLIALGFTVLQIGDVIYISHPTDDFLVNVSDGQGGTAMTAAKGTIQKFSDLPAKAVDGFTVRIIQQSASSQDDYYVKFSLTAGQSTGVWKECLAPGAALGLDPNWMPPRLINDGGWKLQVGAWKQRAVGNEELIRDPDFVGQTVQDLTFWQGRLGIVAGEGVTLSCADDPYQLYPRTLAAVLDSDPIGRINPAPGETIFRYALPFQNRLVLVGDNIQAQVTEDGILTPSKATIDVMTQHEINSLIRPFAVNGKLYFSTPKGSAASGVIEVQIDRITNNTVGEDLATAAFSYIPAGVDRVAVCAQLYMAVYGTSGSADLYVHLFRHDDQERVQNAFFRWHLPTGYVLGGMFFRNTSLYVLACSGGTAYLLKMDASPLALDPSSTALQTCLDCRATEAQCTSVTYNAGTGKTTIGLPFAYIPGVTCLTVRAPGNGAYNEGYVPTVDGSSGGSSLVVVGNLTGVVFFVGHKYSSIYDLSKLYARDAKGDPVRNGRLQIRKLLADVHKTAYLRAEVTAAARPVRKYEQFGFVYDDPSAHWDVFPQATTRWNIPIMGENEQVDIKIINDSPFGHTMVGFEMVAEFNVRSQRA